MSPTARYVVAGLALAASMTGVDAAPPRAQFSARSELVVLHVRVTDRRGTYATGLSREAFRILEDGVPQDVRFFENADAPVTIGLVIDSSGSMRNVRDRVIAAAGEFVSSSNPDDEVFALVFNDSVRPVLNEAEPFTGDADTLRNALSDVFEPVGRTALYDAVSAALAYGSRGARDRRAIVVLSDGGDNASKTKFGEALEKVESSNAIVYTIALADPFDLESNPKRLGKFAETSGGRSYSPKDAAGIHEAFAQIARDIRHIYTIGYEPRAAGGRGGFRHIRVDAYAPGGRKLDVHTRTGYLAPDDARKSQQ